MNVKERIYLIFARIFPKSYREHFAKILVYAGEKISADVWIGSATVLAFCFFLAINIASWSLFRKFRIDFLAASFVTFFIIELVLYMVIYLKMEDRTKRVEKVLPDTLQLISANLRAGMTPFQALRLAARPEFGPLKEEIEHATANALGTESFSDILLRMSERIKSDMLDRTMKLFTTSMKSGGKLAQLLEELGRDISETNSLKKELLTNTKTYTMFVMFTIIFGAPLLFAISIHFVKIIVDMQAKTGVANVGFGLSFLSGEVVITPDYLMKIAITVIIVTSILASVLIGVIAEGKPKYGLRYAPLILGGSLIVFAAARYLITRFFGSLM